MHWGKYLRIWILKTFEGISPVFFSKSFEFWEEPFSKQYFAYPEDEFYFFGISRFLKISEPGLNEVTLADQKFNRFSKLQFTCLEEVLIVFFVLIGSFGFQNFCDFERIFFVFPDKELIRVLKHAQYVSGGAIQGKFVSKVNILEKNWKIYKKTAETCQIFSKVFKF